MISIFEISSENENVRVLSSGALLVGDSLSSIETTESYVVLAVSVTAILFPHPAKTASTALDITAVLFPINLFFIISSLLLL